MDMTDRHGSKDSSGTVYINRNVLLRLSKHIKERLFQNIFNNNSHIGLSFSWKYFIVKYIRFNDKDVTQIRYIDFHGNIKC